jgi:antitoxin MazE
MKTKLVKIGNSRGIRIPKSMIEEAGIEEVVDLNLRGGQLVIRATTPVREGWEEACRRMHECGDDALIDGPLPSLTKFDEEDWKW